MFKKFKWVLSNLFKAKDLKQKKDPIAEHERWGAPHKH
jgi:hypothetical protein